MAYHVLIFNQSAEGEPDIDLYLGSARTVDQYWEAPALELGLATISEITERADSECGFCLSGPALAAFALELALLYQYWKPFHARDAMSPHHFDVMQTLMKASSDASFASATLIIC